MGSPLLQGISERLVQLCGRFENADELSTQELRLAENAVTNLRSGGVALVDEATPHLREYYDDFVAEFSEEETADYGLPVIGADDDIWEHVELNNPPVFSVGGGPLDPGRYYLSFEGEVAWEPEHGLQLVFEDGQRVCKVGPFDGHMTNASVVGDPGLLDVVYRQR